MNVLYITRKFPPMKGGMEKVSYELYVHLSKLINNVELIKWGGTNKLLPLILPYFLFKSCWILLMKKIDLVYLQDGLLAPLGLILKVFFKKKVVITIHGLDITYKNKFYQFIVPRCVRLLDRVICVSNTTKEECIKRKIPKNKISVISNGVLDEFYLDMDRKVIERKLEERFNISLNDKKILLSVGRLVERKGFHWFVENVIPRLIEKEENFIYLIAGDGSYRTNIEKIIAEKHLEEYVKLLGKVDDEMLKLLYNIADVFVMPNILVDGDMEGFGVATLEASSCGVPVVASNLEGIRDAVVEGENGFLVELYDASGFINVIDELLKGRQKEKKRERIRRFTLEKFSWNYIGMEYLKCFVKVYEAMLNESVNYK